jgi:hypothetical protein
MKTTHYRVISLLLFVLILLIFCSCSAQWHLKKARAKDPSIFEVQTITTIQTIKTPLAELSFNCIELMKNGPIELYSPILRMVNGQKVSDKVAVKLTPVLDAANKATGEIAAVVDCPDSEIVTVTKKETIFLKPSKWYMIMFFAIGFLAGVIVIVAKR